MKRMQPGRLRYGDATGAVELHGPVVLLRRIGLIGLMSLIIMGLIRLIRPVFWVAPQKTH